MQRGAASAGVAIRPGISQGSGPHTYCTENDFESTCCDDSLVQVTGCDIPCFRESKIPTCSVYFSFDELRNVTPPNLDDEWTKKTRREVSEIVERVAPLKTCGELQAFVCAVLGIWKCVFHTDKSLQFAQHDFPFSASKPGREEPSQKYARLDRSAFLRQGPPIFSVFDN